MYILECKKRDQNDGSGGFAPYGDIEKMTAEW